MIKFNDTSIYAGHIKQLLHSFNLPQCQIGHRDDYGVRSGDVYYIEGNSLYRCFKSGYDSYSTERVCEYKLGDRLWNMTKRMEIRSNYYDAYTHEYLGDYLRFIRDYTGVDLMGMYNCFSNNPAKLADSYSFEAMEGQTPVEVEIDSTSTEYTVFAVPAKFNRKYTIAIDWHGTIEVFAGFYRNGFSVVSDVYGDSGKDHNENFNRDTYQSLSGLMFNHPVVYTKLYNMPLCDYMKEGCLKLFIKVPNNCKSSIVVLEGDYSSDATMRFSKSTRAFQKVDGNLLLYHPEIIEPSGADSSITSKDVYCSATNSEDYEYLSKRQLLFMNTGEHYMLADRLVEFLSSMAINPNNEITENIRHLQLKLKYDAKVMFGVEQPDCLKYVPGFYGIWDEGIRRMLFRFAYDNSMNSRFNDITGYLDKDVEQRMGNFDVVQNLPDKEGQWQLRE